MMTFWLDGICNLEIPIKFWEEKMIVVTIFRYLPRDRNRSERKFFHHHRRQRRRPLLFGSKHPYSCDDDDDGDVVRWTPLLRDNYAAITTLFPFCIFWQTVREQPGIWWYANGHALLLLQPRGGFTYFRSITKLGMWVSECPVSLTASSWCCSWHVNKPISLSCDYCVCAWLVCHRENMRIYSVHHRVTGRPCQKG